MTNRWIDSHGQGTNDTATHTNTMSRSEDTGKEGRSQREFQRHIESGVVV
jgi:hypothetical protein